MKKKKGRSRRALYVLFNLLSQQMSGKWIEWRPNTIDKWKVQYMPSQIKDPKLPLPKWYVKYVPKCMPAKSRNPSITHD